ncbi:hypothetical protein H6P81_005006 [Aristolochia fimbriata]|uniref:Uncharacterized protein n=1 Tax=Aristolochia fimbriata TaxID=158543 RepID=A0AAV7EWT1_ARIFI|nr:hypothetical protein H6P81_005006 [Aristolochia fimbriata]
MASFTVSVNAFYFFHYLDGFLSLLPFSFEQHENELPASPTCIPVITENVKKCFFLNFFSVLSFFFHPLECESSVECGGQKHVHGHGGSLSFSAVHDKACAWREREGEKIEREGGRKKKEEEEEEEEEEERGKYLGPGFIPHSRLSICRQNKDRS